MRTRSFFSSPLTDDLPITFTARFLSLVENAAVENGTQTFLTGCSSTSKSSSSEIAAAAAAAAAAANKAGIRRIHHRRRRR